MEKFAGAFVLLTLSGYPITAAAEVGVVVETHEACDYFIADGPNGFYVLEWWGGYRPDVGDQIDGEIGDYGMIDAYFPEQDRMGAVSVEDHHMSKRDAHYAVRELCITVRC